MFGFNFDKKTLYIIIGILVLISLASYLLVTFIIVTYRHLSTLILLTQKKIFNFIIVSR